MSTIDICGIANVSTRPDYGGRGVATALVRRAIATCGGMGSPIVSLLTGHGGEGYRVHRSLGFSNTAFPRVYVGALDGAEGSLGR